MRYSIISKGLPLDRLEIEALAEVFGIVVKPLRECRTGQVPAASREAV